MKKWVENTFKDTAFSATESLLIKGKPWVLSIREIERYLPRESERACYATKYAQAYGAESGRFGTFYWLSSPDLSRNGVDAVYINGRGHVMEGGRHYFFDGMSFNGYGEDVTAKMAVRPAVRIQLK